MASLFSPFRHGYRYMVSTVSSDLPRLCLAEIYPWQQRQAHEQPVIFYSCVIGLIGPAIVFVVPPIRQKLGYKPAERPPTTYPRAS